MHIFDAQFRQTVLSNRRGRLLATLIAALAAFLCLTATASAHDMNVCSLKLTPKSAVNPLGASHTVTATLTIRGGNSYITPGQMCAAGGGGPAVGKTVTFTILSGPNAGLTDVGTTDANGQVSVTYVGHTVGEDLIGAAVQQDVCDATLTDDQTLADCPTGYVRHEVISDYAVKTWFNPYAPGGGDGSCTDNPYYYTSVYCNPYYGTAYASGKKHSVGFSMGKKCKTKPIKLSPTYDGGTVASSKLYLDGHKYKDETVGPFVFKIGVKKFKKGSKHTLKLSTVFTSGDPIVLKTSFKKCGKAAKSH